MSEEAEAAKLAFPLAFPQACIPPPPAPPRKGAWLLAVKSGGAVAAISHQPFTLHPTVYHRMGLPHSLSQDGSTTQSITGCTSCERSLQSHGHHRSGLRVDLRDPVRLGAELLQLAQTVADLVAEV